MTHTTQIWELTGSTWRLPISVESTANSDIVIVRDAAVTLLKIQTSVLHNVLSQLAIGGREGEWMVPLNALSQCAAPTQRTNIEEIVIWRGEAPTIANFPNEPVADEFITEWMMVCGLFNSKATASTVYASLMTHMVHWLVNKRRSINLLFAVIHPLQYRRNWKEIVLGRFLQDRVMDKRPEKTFPCLDWVTGYTPTHQELIYDDLTAFNEAKKVCDWVLEIEQTPWFKKHSVEREVMIRKKLGQKGYGSQVVKQIAAHLAQAQQIWSRYTHEMVGKVVELPDHDRVHGKIVTHLQKYTFGKGRRAARAVVVPHALTPDSIAACDWGKAPEEDDEVSEVSSVPLSDRTVREAGPDVSQPQDELP